MIEVIYKEEKQEANGNEALFAIPRNIRQIGLVSENCRIYIEDYVYTFLVRLANADKEKENPEGCLAVFTGETKWAEGNTYIFIRGAVLAEDMEATLDHIDFTDEIWGKLNDEKEKYFPDQEIVGWFFAKAQIPVEATEIFTRTHLKHFGGEKVLMLMEPSEREDAFFRYENSFLVRQSGYYIYYEKNTQMQTYMIEKNKEIIPPFKEEVQDEAVRNFRKIIKSKKKEDSQKEQEHTPVFSYAATACLALAVMTVGVTFYRNYQAMETTERQEVKTVSAVIETVTPTLSAVSETVVPTLSAVSETVTSIPYPSETETQQIEEGKETQETVVDTSGITEETVENSTYYQEESDVRKAKRREELEAKSSEEEQTASTLADDNQDTVSTAVNQAHETYVIRPGDTLYQISISKYGDMSAIEEICRLNNLTGEEIIYPGQVIVLP